MSDPHSDQALHRDAISVLEAWSAPNAAQEQRRERYLRHLYAHPDGMTRGCFPDHLTASTFVVSADRTQALLTLHAKAHAWFQFGGHCEAGDRTLLGAAQREAREESGIADLRFDPVPLRLDEHAVPFCGDRPGVHHLDVWFLAYAPEDSAHAISDESLDVRWWPLAALPGEHGWGEAVDLLNRR